MWLINTETLKLKSVVNPESVEYAILSHTWEEDEVSFQDFQDLKLARTKRGFEKIRKTCRLARKHGYRYAWVDTCCIDKSSSAELSEAINSMFRWYKGAKRCYVYLSDYRRTTVGPRFGKCRWFTRGWTLQELIAPASLTFYNRYWDALGSKTELSEMISGITKINTEVLLGQRDINTIDVVYRMSWAAGRETSRPEDVAYCLFGIFDVNLPMLYGEGTKAFLRLQEEICQRINDLTLFAWKTDTDEGMGRGIFARSPDEFSYASAGKYMRSNGATDVRVSNRGIVFDDAELAIIEGQGPFLPLHFYPEMQGSTHAQGGIFLEKTPNGYARVKASQLFVPVADERWLPSEQINVISWGTFAIENLPDSIYVSTTSDNITIRNVCPRRQWDPYKKLFMNVASAMVELEVNIDAFFAQPRSVPLLALFHFDSCQILEHDIVNSDWGKWSNALENIGKTDTCLSWDSEMAHHFSYVRHNNSGEGTRVYLLPHPEFVIEGEVMKVGQGWRVEFCLRDGHWPGGFMTR